MLQKHHRNRRLNKHIRMLKKKDIERFIYDDYNMVSFEEITNDDWSTLELEGAVFLPAAGSRYENSVNLVGSYGYYWSSTANSKPGAYFFM